jgi:hypothetical protein
MSFDFDGTGIVVEDKKFEKKLLPKGNYDFEIVEFVSKAGNSYPLEGKTKNGDPKVDILAQVINSAEFDGERIFHSVTFMPKDKPGAGMAIHFLKTIGQPYEGKFNVNPEAWVGERFRGYVISDEYQGKKSNKIKGIEPIGVPNAPGSDLPF